MAQKVKSVDGDLNAGLMAAFLVLLSGIFLGYLQLKPDQNDRDVALVFSPQKSLGEIVSDLSSLPVQFVRTGIADFIIIVRPNGPDAFQKLGKSNEFFMLSAVKEGGCLYLDRKIDSKGTPYERVKRT